MIKVVYVPCLFSPDRVEFNTHNLTVSSILFEMMRKHPELHKDGAGFRVRVNGKILSPFKYRAILKDGDRVLIIQEIGIFSAIVALLGIGGTFFGAGIGGGAMIGLTIAALATILDVVLTIAAVVYSYCSTEKPKKTGQGLGTSPTYGWDGIKTQSQPGVPVPLAYGEHMVGGNVIGAYVSSNGDKNFLNMLIALCEGPIEGIMKEDESGVCTATTDTPSILINDNPFSNFEGDVEWDYRLGEDEQTAIPGFTDAIQTYSLGSPLITTGSPYTYTTIGDDVQAFECRFRIPTIYASHHGNYYPTNVKMTIYYRVHGTEEWTDAGSLTISGSSQSALRRFFRVDGLAPEQYDIKVVRITDNPSPPITAGDLYWDYVNEINYDEFTYPFTSLLKLRILATDRISGQVPNIKILGRWKKVLNLDTDVVEWTQNAIYNTNDILTCESGLGRYISQTNINNDQLIEQADYCDEIIGDGYNRETTAVDANTLTAADYTFVAGDIGKTICCECPTDATIYTNMVITSVPAGVATGAAGWTEGTPVVGVGWEWGEKRYELDIVIDTQDDALSMISQICGSFRCAPLWVRDSIQLIIDKKQDPCYAFNMGNILAGSFQDSFSSLKSIPNSIDVNFADKTQNYTKQTIGFADHEAIEGGEQLRPITMDLFGATRRSQVTREARFHTWAYKYQDEQVAFGGGIDSIHVMPGNVIQFQHDVTQWGYGGRIVNRIIDPIEVEDSTGSTYNRGDFTEGNAFFWSSIDLSPLAGTDLGSTPNRIIVVDGAGKVATGYLAGVGAEETLGGELVTGWTNASYDTFTSIVKDITSAIDLGGTCIGVSNTTAKNTGELLKLVSTLTLGSGQAPSLAYDGFSYIVGTFSDGLNTFYHNTLNRTDTAYRIYNTEAANWSSINSSKQVTDPPATACHIVSSLNGTTRAWEYVEAGFNPNDIASWEIFQVQTTSLRSVELDKEIEIEAGDYQITIRQKDGDGLDILETRAITNGIGFHTLITVGENFSIIPETYGLWLIEKVAGNTKTFRIMSVKRTPENEMGVVASEYHEQCYSDTDIILPIPFESMLPNPVLCLPVENLSVIEKGNVLGDGTWVPYLEVGFSRPENEGLLGWDHAEIWVGLSTTFYEYYGNASQPGFKIDAHDFLKVGNIVYVKAVSVNKNGTKDNFIDSPYDSVLITGKTDGPSDITGFNANQYTDKIVLSWNQPEDADIKCFEIREGTGWGSSQLVATQVFGLSLTLFLFSSGWQNYLIKGIDTSGNYSDNAAECLINITITPSGSPLATINGLLIPSSYSDTMLFKNVWSYDRMIGLVPTREWDDGSDWDEDDWDLPVELTGYFETEEIDIGSIQSVLFSITDNYIEDGDGQGSSIDISVSTNGADWSEYEEFIGNTEYNCRYAKFKITLTTDNASENIFCIQLTISAFSIGGYAVDRGDPDANDWEVGDFITDGTWRDLDCSAIVPAGARFINFKLVVTDDATQSGFRLRKNGNANAVAIFTVFTQAVNVALCTYSKVACDNDRIVEYMGDNLTFTTINLIVMGWEL